VDRELILPGICQVTATELTPAEDCAFKSAARGEFPLGFGRLFLATQSA
jgi:hypothetical protein